MGCVTWSFIKQIYYPYDMFYKLSKQYSQEFENKQVKFSVLYNKTDKFIKRLELILIVFFIAACALYGVMGLYFMYINTPVAVNPYLGYKDEYILMTSLDAALQCFVSVMLFLCAWKYCQGRKYLKGKHLFDMMPFLIVPVLCAATISFLEVFFCGVYII